MKATLATSILIAAAGAIDVDVANAGEPPHFAVNVSATC